jgi:hypothetical protein
MCLPSGVYEHTVPKRRGKTGSYPLQQQIVLLSENTLTSNPFRILPQLVTYSPLMLWDPEGSLLAHNSLVAVPIQGQISPLKTTYRAVNTRHLGYKNQ